MCHVFYEPPFPFALVWKVNNIYLLSLVSLVVVSIPNLFLSSLGRMKWDGFLSLPDPSVSFIVALLCMFWTSLTQFNRKRLENQREQAKQGWFYFIRVEVKLSVVLNLNLDIWIHDSVCSRTFAWNGMELADCCCTIQTRFSWNSHGQSF